CDGGAGALRGAGHAPDGRLHRTLPELAGRPHSARHAHRQRYSQPEQWGGRERQRPVGGRCEHRALTIPRRLMECWRFVLERCEGAWPQLPLVARSRAWFSWAAALALTPVGSFADGRVNPTAGIVIALAGFSAGP